MDKDNLFLDRLYAVAMEPERFSELIEIWNERFGHGSGAGVFDLEKFESHVARTESLPHLSVTQSKALPDPLTEKLEAEPHPVLACNSDGMLLVLNTAAERAFGPRQGQSFRALPFDPDFHEIFQHYLMADDRAAQDAQNLVKLIRVWRQDTDEHMMLALSRWTNANGQRLAFIKIVNFNWPDKLTGPFQAAFDLTDAEMAVTKRLAEGVPLTELAGERGASITTVRSQVRSIYAKMSINSQSEFMRMTLGLTTLGVLNQKILAGAFFTPVTKNGPPHPLPHERHLIPLPDGRVLDYSDYGDPQGLPCLYFHSEFFGDSIAASVVADARKRGLRIISPARPHYARTDPYPPGVHPGQQFAQDTAFLLDHLGLDKVTVLSQCMGATIFAIQFMHYFETKTKAAVYIIPLIPYVTRYKRGGFFDFHGMIFTVSQKYPRMLKFIARSGLAYHNRVGTRKFFKVFAENNPADLAAMDDDDIFATMSHGASLVGDRGHEGYYHDFRAIPNTLEAQLAGFSVPVDFVVGSTFPRDRASHVFELLDHKPNFTTTVAEGGGQFCFHTHPHIILSALEVRAKA